MSDPFDSVVLGDLVTTADILADGWVAVHGEIIAQIGQGAPPPARATHDHRGRLILPGLVDGHMHTASAIGGAGIEGATRSAAAGGVTTRVDMPYDVPVPVTDAAILADKIGWVERTAHVDMALYGTIRKAGGVGAIAESFPQDGRTSHRRACIQYFCMTEDDLVRLGAGESAIRRCQPLKRSSGGGARAGRFPLRRGVDRGPAEAELAPYHGRSMRARVAAALLRGQVIWDGTNVLARPGSGRFIRRAN